MNHRLLKELSSSLPHRAAFFMPKKKASPIKRRPYRSSLKQKNRIALQI
jgi:hypothetical protein